MASVLERFGHIPDPLHPRFKSVVEHFEPISFSRFVERSALETLGTSPLVVRWELSTAEEDRAGADGFFWFVGLENLPIAIDITVSDSPERAIVKDRRTGVRFGEHAKRILGGNYAPEGDKATSRILPIFLNKRDFVESYSRYTTQRPDLPSKVLPRAVQAAIWREFCMGLLRLYEAESPGNPKLAKARWSRQIAEWSELIENARA